MEGNQQDFYHLLKKIDGSNTTQRALARETGWSLGKANYVLRALLDKGLVKLENFHRSDNKLGYRYLLTPAGITAKTNLARRFMSYKIEEYERLRQEIDALRRELE